MHFEMNHSEETMEFTIRDARPEDAPILAEFNAAMALETEARALEPQILAQGVRAVFDDPARGRYFVAQTSGGEIIGQTLITTEWSDWRNGDFWWIQSVYVRGDWRRRGVFKALYAHVMERARATTGVCGLRLYVEKANRIAQQTYNRLGMTRTHYEMFEVEF